MKGKSHRVLRGGCWSGQLSWARMTYRVWFASVIYNDFIGVRLTRSIYPLGQIAEVENER